MVAATLSFKLLEKEEIFFFKFEESIVKDILAMATLSEYRRGSTRQL